jgi:TolB-like protein
MNPKESLTRIFLRLGRSCCFAPIQGGAAAPPYRSACGWHREGYEISGLTLLLFAALGIIAHAADAPKSALTVAVCDFTGNADVDSYRSTVTTLVTVNLTSATNLVMVERAELTAALKEQALGVSGMVNPEAAAKIGQITGAKVLVSGQVMKVGDNHLVVVANIVGTETGRLFADKVEGAADNLLELTDELSRKIAQTISDQSTNLIAPPQETSAQRLDRVIKGLGTNRPTVSVNILWTTDHSQHSPTVEAEFGVILLKAGFTEVDANSDRKPDIEITGVERVSQEPRQGALFTCHDILDLKVQEQRTGKILAVEHEVGSGTADAAFAANAASKINAVDTLSERILPLLAK